MPGRGNARGHGGKGNAGGHGRGHAGTGGEGTDMPVQEQHGRSESSPGHLKKAAGAPTARDFAPGHGGRAPGKVGQNGGGNGTETLEPDPLLREG